MKLIGIGVIILGVAILMGSKAIGMESNSGLGTSAIALIVGTTLHVVLNKKAAE
ncbi:MAG: hypothetical protein HRT72_05450 [Flavobacteriales bacterium]|nr:hypothetical protein [Flavobacteriales bacterium]